MGGSQAGGLLSDTAFWVQCATIVAREHEGELGRPPPAQVDANVNITITGIDKYKVGQLAAEIRDWRKPEPYKVRRALRLGLRLNQRKGPPACLSDGSDVVHAIYQCVAAVAALTQSVLALQGKGIRYAGEVIKLKEGKKGK